MGGIALATRRMISRDVIGESQFLRLSHSAMALYMFLVTNADDEGIVDTLKVQLMIRATDKDLQELIEQGYAIPLKTNDRVYLPHWLQMNNIPPSKRTPSKWLNLLAEVVPTAEIADRNGKTINVVDFLQESCNTHASCMQNACTGKDRLVQDRLVQDSTGEVSSGKKRKGQRREGKNDDDDYSVQIASNDTAQEEPSSTDAEPKLIFGKYRNVLLTQWEYNHLTELFDDANDKIEWLSYYLSEHPEKHYSNHHETIIRWETNKKAQQALE